MTSRTGGIDSMKLQIIQACLETQFRHVTFDQKIRPTFTFHNGDHNLSWLLGMHEEFFADQMSREELWQFIDAKAIKKILQNPGKRIRVSRYRDITVEERILS
ncbi:hypothetical protein [Candidatus Nitrospira nitrificans]|uniref:Uncharacterized protein n=1 Tax=Candidatus Nitrospira nitrificans TaxID=1742973 RepID=A0A0S4LCY1_9BACT|nr:hypothetical protein [Candidatus Nitrospira nitrificans]CUS34464.1 hypothetical protein COMA2_170019 [Candidatus Nitrospira nitrificans]